MSRRGHPNACASNLSTSPPSAHQAFPWSPLETGVSGPLEQGRLHHYKSGP